MFPHEQFPLTLFCGIQTSYVLQGAVAPVEGKSMPVAKIPGSEGTIKTKIIAQETSPTNAVTVLKDQKAALKSSDKLVARVEVQDITKIAEKDMKTTVPKSALPALKAENVKVKIAEKDMKTTVPKSALPALKAENVKVKIAEKDMKTTVPKSALPVLKDQKTEVTTVVKGDLK